MHCGTPISQRIKKSKSPQGSPAADDTAHYIRRVLTSDYAKKQNCTSCLEIDGALAVEADLAKLGIALSQPPLQAPVLAQHTLSYIFSVRPQDRATYFKSLARSHRP